MQVTPELVRHVAALARVRLSDAEVEQFTRELAAIVAFVGELDTLDVTGIEPAITGEENVGRDDELRPLGDRRAILDQVPSREGDSVRVPGVLS